MKQKLAVLFIGLCLMVALTVPAFAAEYPDDYPNVPEHNHANDFSVITSNGDAKYLFSVTGDNDLTLSFSLFDSNAGPKIQITVNKTSAPFTVREYNLANDTWTLTNEKTYENGGVNTSFFADIVWANRDIRLSDGTLYYDTGNECDGSTCPATDADYNNVCDDCGMVLTYSLRSTLLQYAQAHAESHSYWPYYAIVEHPTADTYYVYMSQDVMTADEETGTIVTSPNMYECTVFTDSDGVHSYTGNYSIAQWSGSLIYSNHDIANFRHPPLAETIRKVTEEVLEEKLPEILETMGLLTVCGIGCLALLIVLILFGKRSLIFRN